MGKKQNFDLSRDRASGVLMHISSLPGNTGIGTLGKIAYDFVDFLRETNQRYWQILPICPTSFGDSPYQSFSSFAGNPYFIDLDLLREQGLLDLSDYENIYWGDDPTKVDYSIIYRNRSKVLEKVYSKFFENVPAGFAVFCNENAAWLEDYSLFMAIKDEHGGKAFSLWEDDIRMREKDALSQWRRKCSDRVEYYKMLQYLFYVQWNDLKEYANERGILIIGDIPIYISGDSADVWTNPEEFYLDEAFHSIEVAGCPPDAFSAEGQLWGNPLYDWEHMKENDFSWWKNRLKKNLEIYDILRIDHFLGFETYYCIPYGSENAKTGYWKKGPGIDFWNNMKTQLGDLPIIAEDLGVLSDSVKEMLKNCGFPGMKVLQFAFDSREKSDYLPYKYHSNCVVYTGTHDNNTLVGWLEEICENDLKYAMDYLGVDCPKNIPEALMVSAISCVANTCILTLQDLIGLGVSGRMNVPSTVGNNWCWRATKEELDMIDKNKLSHFTNLYGRNISTYL